MPSPVAFDLLDRGRALVAAESQPVHGANRQGITARAFRSDADCFGIGPKSAAPTVKGRTVDINRGLPLACLSLPPSPPLYPLSPTPLSSRSRPLLAPSPKFPPP